MEPTNKMDPWPNSEEARAILVDASKARLTGVLLAMLVEQRARVLLLCAERGTDPETYFALPEVVERMPAYLAEASRSEESGSVGGWVDR